MVGGFALTEEEIAITDWGIALEEEGIAIVDQGDWIDRGRSRG